MERITLWMKLLMLMSVGILQIYSLDREDELSDNFFQDLPSPLWDINVNDASPMPSFWDEDIFNQSSKFMDSEQVRCMRFFSDRVNSYIDYVKVLRMENSTLLMPSNVSNLLSKTLSHYLCSHVLLFTLVWTGTNKCHSNYHPVERSNGYAEACYS